MFFAIMTIKKRFVMTADKIRTNVYLDKQLKEEAKKLFKEYGMSFSDGLNFLLRQVVTKKEVPIPNELEIEPVYPDDPDYKVIEKRRKSRHKDEYVSMDQINWD